VTTSAKERLTAMSKPIQMPDWARYLLLGFLLWCLVDFGTAGGFRIAYFKTYGPTLLLFYLGYPLVFTALIFRFHWSQKRLFIATLVGIFLVEAVFARNPLVTTFPALILGIPLAILVYAPLTYFPLWIVRREIARRRALAVGLTIVELVIMMLTTFGQSPS